MGHDLTEHTAHCRWGITQSLPVVCGTESEIRPLFSPCSTVISPLGPLHSPDARAREGVLSSLLRRRGGNLDRGSLASGHTAMWQGPELSPDPILTPLVGPSMLLSSTFLMTLSKSWTPLQCPLQFRFFQFERCNTLVF